MACRSVPHHRPLPGVRRLPAVALVCDADADASPGTDATPPASSGRAQPPPQPLASSGLPRSLERASAAAVQFGFRAGEFEFVASVRFVNQSGSGSVPSGRAKVNNSWGPKFKSCWEFAFSSLSSWQINKLTSFGVLVCEVQRCFISNS